MQIALQTASIEEKFLLRNLMELCQYDYSEFNGRDVGACGLFGYTYLDHYWTDPDRFPFLVRVDGASAGFVLVRRVDAQPTYSIAEFFVLRKYRGQKVGQRTAHQIFGRFPGAWQVEQEAGNLPARRFWNKVIARFTNNTYREEETETGFLQTFSKSTSASLHCES